MHQQMKNIGKQQISMENSSADDDLIDVCQLDYEQRIFLCYQVVKKLRQESDL